MTKYEITLLLTPKGEGHCIFKKYYEYGTKTEALFNAVVEASRELPEDYEISYWHNIKKINR